ncbi:hypothetical protein E3J62_02485 [candidate division TA06 bacterium]|uniref:Putative oxidoreductase/dehydrogenase Rossmann-like domain-containing protein n=1 Tax=candidate division TA06 bacterium TaxID=2250710 RepID=A0A523UX04_UNCT6|nr:MAG: hypothetical protein E3J62_02485 [candidate division TA06 bacterium]
MSYSLWLTAYSLHSLEAVLAKITIIGLGRVGTALGILLSKAGHQIVSAFDINPASSLLSLRGASATKQSRCANVAQTAKD